MRHTDPPVAQCDCRRVSVRNVMVISIAIGVIAAVLRGTAFADRPDAQAICGSVVGLAIVAYAGARLYDQDRRISSAVYVVLVGVGLALSILWISRLF